MTPKNNRTYYKIFIENFGVEEIKDILDFCNRELLGYMEFSMELDIFLYGETVDLCVPTLDFIRKQKIYSWWNNPMVTQYLNSGVFPNTLDKQIAFYEKYLDKDLILLITDKTSEPIGTIQISAIDYQRREGELGIVMGNVFRKNPLEALEAVALITEHAFLKLGLERIVARQHIGLIMWSSRMALLGYRIEGIFRNAFVKGKEVCNQIRIACLYDDYCRIINQRGGGTLWDSQAKMMERIKRMPKRTFHHELRDFFEKSNEYYTAIDNL